MTTVTIWIDAWQTQCCGEAFAPGDVVSWKLLEAKPENFADIVGGDRAAEIDFREEHHGDGNPPPTRLKVLTVTEVHCRIELPPGADAYRPAPGTAELVPAERADGWTEPRQDLRFMGYLVTADPATNDA
ncbi:DUF6578 domain-containing protein [Streptomyces sp. KAU_LT]|uniref:DUF6578 domain-containing protein n=1 Tax=Streptomyces sp. KAU_LT TaxID=3046669 RepID=UPI0024B67117|nr:DUF6578 domain-containing protein [Streptomyces sp. KAU_LT]MDI9832451.1 hypothetical protein [Streptomyces sp. KAU_LT]